MTAVPKIAPANAMIGAVLGAYRITGELSRGGMGAVFSARHELLGRPAAVKLLRPELTENDELVQRFFNEAKAATAIRHPGIVEVFDFGYTDQGHAFLVMELLDGRTLAKALAKVVRFTELEAANIARGVASALKAAHAQGIIHRDLKPDNIFLVPDLDGPTNSMRTKVLDFGIAKLSTAERQYTQAGVLIGTPLYMAPEQARAASAIDHRADLYSLGCILYELLVGTPPFPGEGAGEVIAMHMFTEPRPVREHVPEISFEMQAIVGKLLAKDPAERYQTANEVMQALASVGARLSVELGVALPPGSGQHSRAYLQTSAREALAASSGFAGARSAAEGSAKSNDSLRLPLVEPPPAKRSAMPIVAGAITLAIAAIAIAVIATHEPAAAPPPAPVPAPVVTPPAPPPAKAVAPVVTPPPDREIQVIESAPPTPGKPVKAPAGTVKKKPKGPTTDNGSPIELDLDDHKKDKKP